MRLYLYLPFFIFLGKKLLLRQNERTDLSTSLQKTRWEMNWDPQFEEKKA